MRQHGNIQDGIDQRKASHQEYEIAFMKARATNALWSAMSEDPLQAVMEAVSEASAAIEDIDVLRSKIAEQLHD